MTRPKAPDRPPEVQRREMQAISAGAGFAFMLTLGLGPMVVLVHHGPWTPFELLCPVGVLLVGAFSLAILVRAQRLRPGESIFAGRFGLAIALCALLVCVALLALDLWSLAEGHEDHVPPRYAALGHAAPLLGIGYLGRVVYRNLTGQLELPAPPGAEDDDDDDDDADDDE